MSVVEAMQRGLVPIVTPVGEIAKYCQHDVNALVANNFDNPAIVAKEVVALLHDKARYCRYQKAAMGCWQNASLYQDDVCRAANELAGK